MKERVFIQRSRLDRKILVLRDDEVEITEGAGERRRIARFPLRTISPDYFIGSKQLTGAVVFFLIVAVASTALAIFLYHQHTVPTVSALYPAMFAVTSAIVGMRFVRRFDFFTFKDQRGKPLFSVARELGQIEECDTFVSDLLNRIDNCERGQDGTPLPSVELGEAVDLPTEWRWKSAIAAGAVTLTYPLIAQLTVLLSSIEFAVVIASATCAIVAAFFSYSEKERHRHWSLMGPLLAALALTIFQ
jgi:hypothetical protein